MATAVAMHGFRVQVQAQGTQYPNLLYNCGQTRMAQGVGFDANLDTAKSLAAANAQLQIANQPWTNITDFPMYDRKTTLAVGEWHRTWEPVTTITTIDLPEWTVTCVFTMNTFYDLVVADPRNTA